MRRLVRVVVSCASLVALLAVAPPPARAEPSGEARLDGDGLDAAVEDTRREGRNGGGAGRTSSPRRAVDLPSHLEVTYVQAAFGPCGDGLIEIVKRVWDDGSGRVIRLRAGCPRPTLPRAVAPGRPAPPPSARRVRDAVGIPVPAIAVDPTGRSLTGLATRFWVDGPSQRTVTASIDGFTVTATARAVRYDWATGDGTTYTTATGGTATRPAVTHAYARKGTKTVEVTAVWEGTFTFTGPAGAVGGGDLGRRGFSSSRAVPVAEVQAVGRR